MAQSTAGTNIVNNANSANRQIAIELRIAWGRDANDWPTNWATQSTDETARLLNVSWDRRLEIDSAQGRSAGPLAQMRLALDNRDQRFSPYNEAGSLHANLNGQAYTAGNIMVRFPKLWMTPIRLRMGFVDANAGAQMLTVFTGAIDEVQEGYGIDGAQVTLTCLDRGAALLSKNASTSIKTATLASEWIRFLVSTLGNVPTGQTLDRAFFTLPYAWLDDEPLWNEVQQVAQADSGFAYFDELGVFYYRNAAWWATAAHSLTSQATISTRFQTFSPEYSYRNVATGVRVEYQPREPGGEQVIWRSDKTIVVPPNGETIEARFQYPAFFVLTPAKPGDWLPISSGGLDLSDKVQLDIVDFAAQRATLQFTSTANQTAFIPKMQLRGPALVGGPQEQIDKDASAALVPENRKTISGNVYIQTRAQADMVASIAAQRMAYPRLTHQFRGVPALPWLQLGDRITIDVPEPMTADRYGIVTALAFSWQPKAGFLMDIDAVDVGGLFEYDDYHVLGTDDYGQGTVFL